MKYFLALSLALIAAALPASAHVGSPDVFYEGNAGPYRLFVTVRVPQVIPGIAEVDVRSESPDVTSISIAPMQLTGPGSQYAPAPDVAIRSQADPQSFTGSVWLMEFGSLQVRLQAGGARGPGTLAVPVPAIAQRMLPMQRPLEILLFALMLLLAVAMVSIAAAAVREGSLSPGAAPGAAALRRNRFAMVVAAVIIVGLLYLGRQWWRADAAVYARNVYSPPALLLSLTAAGHLRLREAPGRLASGNPRRASNLVALDHLIPDHSHLMHLFLIRTPGMDSFWHLHPQPSSGGEFSTDLPSLPAGHYKVFADVVLSSGFPMTMLGELDVPATPRGGSLVGDDSAVAANPLSATAADALSSPLPDGGRMVWLRDAQPVKSNVPLSLRFQVEDSVGKPVHDLQPYMGMPAHAEIIRSDGAVFAHIHPAGSVSMAALDIAQMGLPQAPQSAQANGDSGMSGMNMPGMNMPGMNMSGANTSGMNTSGGEDDLGPEVSFPYGFPQPGLYRLFVQVKRSGRVETGVFDVTVQ